MVRRETLQERMVSMGIWLEVTVLALACVLLVWFASGHLGDH